MGKEGTCLPPGKCKVFLYISSYSRLKVSVDELYMHYFHNLSSAFGGFAPDPHREPTGGLSFPDLSTPGKNPTGVHDDAERTHAGPRTWRHACTCKDRHLQRKYLRPDRFKDTRVALR